MAKIVFRLLAIGWVWQAIVLAPVCAQVGDAEVIRQQHANAIEQATTDADRELAILRSRIFEANQRLTVENRVLNARQRELELADPIAKGLREKLIEREKELIQLRRSLQSRLEAIPEIQELTRQRADLVEEVKSLRQRERELLTGRAAAAPSS